MFAFCSYQSTVPCVLPYPLGQRQHRFINPIHGNCILSYDSYDCEPFYTHTLDRVLSFCFHLLIVINLCLSVLCIKSDFCIYISHIETGIDFVNCDCDLRSVCVNYSGSSEDLKRHTQFAWLHSLDAVKYLADFAYFRFKDNVPTETEKYKTKNKKICTGNCYRLLW